MVVQHNMQAMNANRMLNVTTGAQSKSTEKLSSGYKINRAADDAAGLSISEKMRKQIRGLDQASSNAQDGVSAVQTAEGALTEVHSMLQRMNELAVQASNGTNSESDRQSIQDEIDQLTTEIDRVAETTKFNETYLLKGNAEGTSSSKTVNAHDAGIKGTMKANGDGTSTFTLDAPLKAGSKITVAGKEITIGDTKTADDYDTLTNVQNTVMQVGDSITKADGSSKTLTSNATASDIYSFVNTKATNTTTLTLGTVTTADGTTYTLKTNGTNNELDVESSDSTYGTAGTKNISNITDGSADSLQEILGASIDLNGATFTTTGGDSYNIVSGLNRDELTSFDASTGLKAANLKADTLARLASNGGTALAAGDSVTTITTDAATGNKVETTKTAYSATASNGAINVSVLAEKLNDFAVGKTVTVADYTGANSTTYTIAGSKEAEAGNTLTVDSILSKLKEGDIISNNVNVGEVYSVAGVDSEEGTTSVKDAYKMIADELAKASSIGTDEGKGAAVTSNGDGTFSIKQGTVEVKDNLSFSLHVGADADMTNKIGVDIESMSAAGLGVKGINVKDDTGMAATYAIDAIADAVAKVSAQRSALGAVQNRLEHTIANVDNVVENSTSAESRIRDTDMAEEMVNYSKNNILAQAGQSMLAQANQSNQGVLSLLG